MNTIKTFTHFENIILNSVTLEDYDINTENMTKFDIINKTFEIFNNEYGYNIPRVGLKQAFKDWIQGLPTVLTVPFYNYDILKNAKKDNFVLNSEELEDKFLETYWTNLATAFFTLKDNL